MLQIGKPRKEAIMNNFNLIGRVNYIDIKYLDSGKCLTRVLLSKKVNSTGDKEKDYASFPVTFFNTRNKNVAEDFGENVKKGDYVQVEGKLQINSYKGKSGDNITTIELIGFDFKKVRYDENQKYYGSRGD